MIVAKVLRFIGPIALVAAAYMLGMRHVDPASVPSAWVLICIALFWGVELLAFFLALLALLRANK